uniref:Guanosine-3',5'-bis(diphosphate) 3'-pyrophosphohydrolase MESH1 n=1 Tax=Romanomermis culicivorax TaxID=13658 RepID=A0A915KLB6_ROMCU
MNSTLHSIIKAANFAAEKHRDQRRKDPQKTPYINHPIGVAHILCDEGSVGDGDVLQAAILHDTVEDTNTSFEELEKNFGKKVRDIVAEVTDDKSLNRIERKKAQISRAKDACHEAKLVKLADKLYNLRDIKRVAPVGWSKKDVDDYFTFSKSVLDEIRGTNESLENALDDIIKNHFSHSHAKI